MRLDSLFRGLFIFYCFEAGCFLVVTPWSLAWDHSLTLLPVLSLRLLCLHPLTRGGVSGFGLIHLLWGGHDIHAWLVERRQRATP